MNFNLETNYILIRIKFYLKLFFTYSKPMCKPAGMIMIARTNGIMGQFLLVCTRPSKQNFNRPGKTFQCRTKLASSMFFSLTFISIKTNFKVQKNKITTIDKIKKPVYLISMLYLIIIS